MPQIIDITMPLKPGMLIYPGNPPFEWEEYRSVESGDSSNNSRFSMGSHVGTHVDAPRHYVRGGAGMESLDPEALLGPCRVFQVDQKQLDAELLSRLDLTGVRRVLFGTPSSRDLSNPEFNPDFAHVTGDGADLLVEAGVRLVGVDYLSVDRYKAPGHPAHHRLLGAGVIVVEGLDLSGVEPGDYELICCPLLIAGAEAAPARVFLRRPDD
ncbi:MAG: cyclase family protein [Armatimonadota bacterium]